MIRKKLLADGGVEIQFSHQGVFKAMGAAEKMLLGAGFSIGRGQAHAPRGALFGSYDIQKWRNLNRADRDALHGAIVPGDNRNGPVIFRTLPACPPEAIAALHAMDLSNG